MPERACIDCGQALWARRNSLCLACHPGNLRFNIILRAQSELTGHYMHRIGEDMLALSRGEPSDGLAGDFVTLLRAFRAAWRAPDPVGRDS